MKRIPLTQGKFVIVDDRDYKWLSQYNWYIASKSKPFRPYAVRQVQIKGKRIQIYMHRLILNAQSKQWVDHINHDGLDNRRANLRICTPLQSNRNKRPFKNKSTSIYKGVDWRKQTKRWRARIKGARKVRYLGDFNSERDAAIAYDNAARELFGDFAWFNFPEST